MKPDKSKGNKRNKQDNLNCTMCCHLPCWSAYLVSSFYFILLNLFFCNAVFNNKVCLLHYNLCVFASRHIQSNVSPAVIQQLSAGCLQGRANIGCVCACLRARVCLWQSLISWGEFCWPWHTRDFIPLVSHPSSPSLSPHSLIPAPPKSPSRTTLILSLWRWTKVF